MNQATAKPAVLVIGDAPLATAALAAVATVLTKEQAIILTGFTGHMLCDLDDFLVDVRVRLGIPDVSEADLLVPHNATMIKEYYAADLQKILPVDWAKEDARHAEPLVLETA